MSVPLGHYTPSSASYMTPRKVESKPTPVRQTQVESALSEIELENGMNTPNTRLRRASSRRGSTTRRRGSSSAAYSEARVTLHPDAGSHASTFLDETNRVPGGITALCTLVCAF
jgi:hypothetical protein